jgi:integrase
MARVIPEAVKRAAAKRQRKPLTERYVSRLPLPPHGEQVDYYDHKPLKKGRLLCLRVSYGGSRTWRVSYYVNGRPKALTIGHYPDMKVEAAREAAHAFDPEKAAKERNAGTFGQAAQKWLDKNRHLRTWKQHERMLRVYVLDDWATEPIATIRKSHVHALLDKVEKKGRAQADAVLGTIRNVMRLWASRSDDYNSPIVPDMKRNTEKKARDRILFSKNEDGKSYNDDEIRAVWNACTGTFGNLVKLLLLTAQRKDKLATLRWTDIVDGVWTVATEKGEKGNIGKVRLPQLALDVIAAQPRTSSAYVFSSRGGPFSSWSQCKAALDKKLPADMPPWVLHDLRRTARSLLSRIGVQRDHAERVLGHTIGGVEGTYDRHPYSTEKSEALQKLALLIEQINQPARHHQRHSAAEHAAMSFDWQSRQRKRPAVMFVASLRAFTQTSEVSHGSS